LFRPIKEAGLMTRSVLVIASLMLAGSVHANDCRIAEVAAPARGETIANARPGIEWRALPDVKRYRVQLESRIPEGRVLHRFDTVVSGTKFVPPSALTDERAAVKVLVTADCGAAKQPSVIEEPARFFIDLTASCPAPSLSVEQGRISWGKVAGAQRYEVAAYAAADGRSVQHTETLDPSYRLPAMPQGGYVMVRARCAEAYSAPVYQGVGPSAR
jgi:hypothetical protein